MNEALPVIARVPGFRVAGVNCGLKKVADALDFALIVSEHPCNAAGVFTTNLMKAAPVLVGMQRLEQFAEGVRAVAVNTGCANACTGRKGIQDAHVTARWTAEALGCREEQVLVMSTGVIGTHLPLDKIKHGIDKASQSLGDDWPAAARAIMTTDTRPKMAALQVTTASGQTYNIAGISKGAGMIAPNMATMLAVVVTDLAVPVYQLQHALKAATHVSYNRIVVDGDMSTNDTVLLLANGASGAQLQTPEERAQFQDALNAVCQKLARDIVQDGEGVTKFISVRITGATDDAAARQIANTIATSPLVKTAFFGGDPNWGRIVAAAGRAGVPIKPDEVNLWLAAGEQTEDLLHLVIGGEPADYNETLAVELMKQPAITVWLDCGIAEGTALVWTCDLSHDYVTINGDYRT